MNSAKLPTTTSTTERTVIVTEGSAAKPLSWLRGRVHVVEAAPGEPEFEKALPACQGMVVRTYTVVNEELLARAPKLKVVGRGGVGLENIDVTACRRRGVEVVYTPDANTHAVVDLVFAQLIRLIRPFNEIHSQSDVSPERWAAARSQSGLLLRELTLGILGMGRVGRAVGCVASAGFGMKVIYHDIVDVSDLVDFPAVSVSVDQLLQQADVLTIHVDGRDANRGLVDRDVLRRVRGRYLVNMSRGMVLDAAAAVDALRQGGLDGLAIDVFDPEPPPADSPFVLAAAEGRNVLLTPHMASRTASAVENMSWVVNDVVAVLNGESPTYRAP